MARPKPPTETLDKLLLACGIGRWQAAVRAGVSPTSLRAWCEGRHRPRNAQVAKLAAALGVPVERVVAAVEASAAR